MSFLSAISSTSVSDNIDIFSEPANDAFYREAEGMNVSLQPRWFSDAGAFKRFYKKIYGWFPALRSYITVFYSNSSRAARPDVLAPSALTTRSRTCE